MATKIYVDTTGELVTDTGVIEERFPAFSELKRVRIRDEYLQIEDFNKTVVFSQTLFSDLQDESGTPYASFAALKTALDGYFDNVA